MFPSGVYHRTCGAEDGTIKLSIFLRASSFLKTDHASTERRILRSQLRYAQPPHVTPVVWGLNRYWDVIATLPTREKGDEESDDEAASDIKSEEGREQEHERKEKGSSGAEIPTWNGHESDAEKVTSPNECESLHQTSSSEGRG